MRVSILGLALAIANFVLAVQAEENPILKRVPELQKTAERTNSGEMGCGKGTVKLITSKGDVSVACGLDPIHVFGQNVKVADLLALLNSRIESNRTGKEGPMSGKVGDLGFVILSTLALSKDPEAVPVIAQLIDDKNRTISDHAVIALIELGNSSPEIAAVVAKIKFTDQQLEGAVSSGFKVPAWLSK